jgi:hypothetical protein
LVSVAVALRAEGARNVALLGAQANTEGARRRVAVAVESFMVTGIFRYKKNE